MQFNHWVLIYLLALHFVSDALLQSRTMAVKKSEDFWWLFFHASIIFSVFLFGVLLVTSDIQLSINFAFANASIHFLIDGLIWRVYKLIVILNNPNVQSDFKYYEDKNFYTTILLDQVLHTSTIIILLGVFK